jgi:hypothetical protein
MPLQIRYGGTWRDPSGCRIYKGGAWRNIVQVKVYSGGAWRDVANFTAPGSGDTPGSGGGSSGSLTLSISPSPSEAASFSSPVTSGNTTATPSGGLAPYTYSWVKLSGDTIVANSPTSAVTTFTGNVPPDATRSAIFRCTCTDSLGATATADVTATLDRISI